MDEQITAQPNNKRFANEYGGLGRLLHAVRWTQHLLAIIAEALILLSFAMSGMDVSLGGVLAELPFVKVLWAGMFALGIDTAFVLGWVRLRECAVRQQWLAFIGNLILTAAMSIIVFQPLAIQLLQQSLNLSFNQAVASLGINIVFLTYARSGVAVFLGAILVMTNVERPTSAAILPTKHGPKQRLLWFVKMPDQSAPALASAAQPDVSTATTPEQRTQKMSEIDLSGMSSYERVAKVLSLFPDVSDRELGRLSKLSAATAKKHKEALQHKQPAEHVAEQRIVSLEG